MDVGRRFVLRSASVTGALAAFLATGLLRPAQALAATWNKVAFGAKNPADALKGIGATGTMESKEVLLDLPQIAENGAVVPIEISSRVPGTTSIALLIEKNPFPLVAQFEFMEGALPYVKLNAKVGESSAVRAIAEAGGKFYAAGKEVKVTIGGCGG